MEHEHKWKVVAWKRGDLGLLGIFTNLAFGGITPDYDILECKECGERKKVPA